MGYMRGAVMKVGQTLTNFPDIVPRQFVEMLDRLFFEAQEEVKATGILGRAVCQDLPRQFGESDPVVACRD
jgi:predicted unusual protein kinase regulating ubiquinone biosynthesis (AarF/ABC1/UbiB family)